MDKSVEGILGRIMKYSRKICLLLCFLLILSVLVPPAVAVSDKPATQGNKTMDAKYPLFSSSSVKVEAQAALLYEVTSDTMMYAYNADARIYPTGLTGIMTCLLALENGNLDDVITVKYDVIKATPSDSTNANLKAGEQITLKDLLYCICLNSSVDAALTVAHHIAGSQEAFVEMMNKKAEDLGCTGTNFTNATGLHDKKHYSTVRDLGKITVATLKSEQYRQMYSVASYEVPKTNKSDVRVLKSTNYMLTGAFGGLYKDERVEGGKTGYSSAAGRCAMVTTRSGDSLYMGILMGGETLYNSDMTLITGITSFSELAKLFEKAYSGFQRVCVVSSSRIIGLYPVENGQNYLPVQPEEDVYAVLPQKLKYEKIRLEPEVSGTIKAPVRAGDRVGNLLVWYNERCVGEISLIAASNVLPEASEPKENIDPIENEQTMKYAGIVIVVLLCVAAIILILALVSYIRTAARNARRRRRRRNRVRRR